MKQHVLCVKGIFSKSLFNENIFIKAFRVALFLNFILLLGFGKLSKIPVLKLISSIFFAVSIKLNPVALDRTFKSN